MKYLWIHPCVKYRATAINISAPKATRRMAKDAPSTGRSPAVRSRAIHPGRESSVAVIVIELQRRAQIRYQLGAQEPLELSQPVVDRPYRRISSRQRSLERLRHRIQP